MLDMILDYELGGIVERGADGGDLHEDFGAVSPLFHHALDGLQMPYRAGKAIHNGLGLGMLMRVGMGMGMHRAIGMNIGMGVLFGIRHSNAPNGQGRVIICIHFNFLHAGSQERGKKL